MYLASQKGTVICLNIKTNSKKLCNFADSTDTVNPDITVLPDTAVSFMIKKINRKGELVGTFEYKGEIFEGVLQNVSVFNRKS